ncbi:MAG: beta-propeller fold lactonase family protein [Acidobacteria bacterium]|nr:beta-propeller fold lactonase family protein [Acidobacteriota bacterium]
MKKHLAMVAITLVGVIGLASSSAGIASGESMALKKPKRDAFFTDPVAGNVYKVQINFKGSPSKPKTPKAKVKKTFGKVKAPWGVAVDPNGKFIVVTDNDKDELVKLDTKKGKVLSKVAVGKGPTDVALSPDGNFAYVVNHRDNSLTIVDTRTDVVIETHKMGKGPLRINVSEDGFVAWVTNVDEETLSIIDLGDAVKRTTARLADTVVTKEPKDDCDVAGGIGSAFFDGGAPFYFYNWACGARSIGGTSSPATPVRVDRRKSGKSANEGQKNKKKGGSPPMARAVNSNAVAFPFDVPGSPDGLIAVGLTRVDTYMSGTACVSNVLNAGYSPLETPEDHSDDEAYIWKFGGNAERLGSGSAFQTMIGGGGDQIYVHPACGSGCSAKTAASKTRQITVKGAEAIQDGAMKPVPFGDNC